MVSAAARPTEFHGHLWLQELGRRVLRSQARVLEQPGAAMHAMSSTRPNSQRRGRPQDPYTHCLGAR